MSLNKKTTTSIWITPVCSKTGLIQNVDESKTSFYIQQNCMISFTCNRFNKIRRYYIQHSTTTHTVTKSSSRLTEFHLCTFMCQRRALTFPWPFISTILEIMDGCASRHGDSTWTVLRDRAAFLMTWYSWKRDKYKDKKKIIFQINSCSPLPWHHLYTFSSVFNSRDTQIFISSLLFFLSHGFSWRDPSLNSSHRRTVILNPGLSFISLINIRN